MQCQIEKSIIIHSFHYCQTKKLLLQINQFIISLNEIKMPSLKGKQKKQIKKTDSAKIEDSVSGIEKSVISRKNRSSNPLDIEDIEESIDRDEKLPVDPLMETNDGDIESDEIGLDDEEIDPFNDKWEQ
jgi:hypothetical protein